MTASLLVAGSPLYALGRAGKGAIHSFSGNKKMAPSHPQTDSASLTLLKNKSKGFPTHISIQGLERLENQRAIHNPSLSSEKMITLILHGSRLFQDLKDKKPLTPPNLDDLLSVSWYTMALTAEKDQTLVSGSLRFEDPNGRLHAYLQSYKNHNLDSSGNLQSSPQPYRRISSHYNEFSTGQQRDIVGNQKQFGIESYSKNALFPGGKNCLLWDQLQSPGSNNKEVFLKFEEVGMPNLLDGWHVKGLGIFKRIWQFYTNFGKNIQHCTNFGKGRGATGKTNATTWKEHVKTNKALASQFKTSLKALKDVNGLPKNINTLAQTVLDYKEFGFDTMMTSLHELNETPSSVEAPKDTDADTFKQTITDIQDEFRHTIDNYYTWLSKQGHAEDAGISRKGNEVIITPFENTTESATLDAASGG